MLLATLYRGGLWISSSEGKEFGNGMIKTDGFSASRMFCCSWRSSRARCRARHEVLQQRMSTQTQMRGTKILGVERDRGRIKDQMI